MSSRGSRAGWWIAIPALILAVWLVGVERGRLAAGWAPDQSRIGERLVRLVTGRGQRPRRFRRRSDAGPVAMSDPRLSSLRQAAQSWKRSAGSRRRGRRPGLPGA